MNQVAFIPNDKGAFAIDENGERIAEMIVGIAGNEISVYHTGVVERLRGQGIARQLVDALVNHARNNQLQVVVYCPYVKAVFKSNQPAYADVWKQH